MRTRWRLFTLVLGLALTACGTSKDGYIVLDVDADATVDRGVISQLQVSAGSVTREYPLSSALPGTVGLVSNHQGILDLSIIAIGQQVTQGSWTGEVTITPGRTVHVPVTLSCKGGGCGSAFSQDAGADVGPGQGGGAGTGDAGGTSGADGGTADGMGCSNSPSCWPFTKIKCGDLQDTCDNTIQVCCRNYSTSTKGPDFHCAAIGTCMDDVEQHCNGPRNCQPGQSCMLDKVTDTLEAYSCVDTATAFAEIGMNTLLCTSSSDCPTGYACTPAPACAPDSPANGCNPNPFSYLSNCSRSSGAAGSGGSGGSGGSAGGGGTSGAGGSAGATMAPAPAVRSSVSVQADPPSVTCTLANVTSGDVLFAGIHTSGSPSTISASDDAGNTFQYLKTWFNIRAGDFVGGAFTKATASGSVSITVSTGGLSENPNTRSGLSVFCYDLAGVATTPMQSSGIGTGTTCALSTPVAAVNNSIAIAVWEMYGSSASITPGPGFTLSPGSPIVAHSNNYVGSEYQVVQRGNATTCPMTMSVSETWDGMCVVFAP